MQYTATLIGTSCFTWLLALQSLVAVEASGAPPTWKPPLGIPSPQFGIDQSVEQVYGEKYCTHFVDNRHEAATDTENPFGTRDRPRKSIPLELSAGSVVEVEGGPYDFGGTRTSWNLTGSRERPIFIRGVSTLQRPVIRGLRVSVRGQFFVIENLEFHRKSPVELAGSHATLRDCEIHDSQSNPAVLASGQDVVIYNCHIHHNITGTDRDCHGTYATSGAKRVWVVDNHIHHNSGDSFQAGHRATIAPQFLYIGRNQMHEDRENAVDIKIADDVIISQNKVYGYKRSSTSGGDAFRINDEGPQKRIWILFNRISDSRWGINPQGCSAPPLVIGNLIYNCQDAAIRQGAESIIHNTIYGCGRGVDGGNSVVNNIICNVEESIGRRVGNPLNNLLWRVRNPASAVDSLHADPLFVDAATGDFRIQDQSPAIDAAIETDVYDLYSQTYGIDIRVDQIGTSRSSGTRPDIGAFEHSPED